MLFSMQLLSVSLIAILDCMAKDTWEKLETKNGGTNFVKKSRLDRLTTNVENKIVFDDESISEFHSIVCDIYNESYDMVNHIFIIG